MKNTVIQFGTGNFLRGFVDDFINTMNERGLYDGKVVIVQPTRGGNADILNEQKGVYNLYLRGIDNGETVFKHTEIHCVGGAVSPYKDYEEYLKLAHNPDFRFVISNTTEAGIEFDDKCKFDDRPAVSFPGKLTQLLYERYMSGLKGFIILACELIDNNGKELKKCVMQYANLWNLGDDFINWLKKNNTFCNTLVDRIVTGYSAEDSEELCRETGFKDKLLDTGEIYHLWVIEGNFENELPLKKAGINVIWTEDVAPYKKMKVRVLNGAHTSIVFPALLCGIETVGECLEDEQMSEFLSVVLNKDILPVLGETDETRAFAAAVIERFENPFIHHELKSIALNSVSKFSVRVLPTMTEYRQAYGEYPKEMVLSMASLIKYYKENDVRDDSRAVDFIKSNSVENILSKDNLWGCDLSDMAQIAREAYDKINTLGIREAIKWALS